MGMAGEALGHGPTRPSVTNAAGLLATGYDWPGETW
jgi:hypothetical protein